MNKAEKFIKEHTKKNTNEIGVIDATNSHHYHEWLTPDLARKAVEIAEEEMIDKFYDWLKNNAKYIHPRKGTEECITTLVKLKQAMKVE